jgi:hypothetical protein
MIFMDAIQVGVGTIGDGETLIIMVFGDGETPLFTIITTEEIQTTTTQTNPFQCRVRALEALLRLPIRVVSPQIREEEIFKQHRKETRSRQILQHLQTTDDNTRQQTVNKDWKM